MNGSDFIRMIQKPGRENNVEVRFVYERGKGSHGTLYYGMKFTVIKDRKKEIGKGLYHAMLKQLGIDERKTN